MLVGMTAFGVLVAALSVSIVSSASHSHGPPVEHDAVHFHYDPEGRYLVAETASRCFLAKLTRDEQDHIHTNTGMDDLELKMLREMLGHLTETKIYHDDAHLPTNIRSWCKERDIFILERPLDSVMTTARN